MNFEFFPDFIKSALAKVNMDKVSEIRLRANNPVILKSDTEYLYLGENGVTKNFGQAFRTNICDIEDILLRVTERSVYAYNESIKQGFITINEGVRIGLAGECVYDNGQVVTIKNITSLNLRIPHKVEGCANEIYKHVYFDGKVCDTLIISAPSYGKTTILKDLAENLSKENMGAILVVDERSEFCGVVGENIDIIKNCSKSYAFDYGIRSMSPKVIITDELSAKSDWECVKKAVTCGVNVIASCHADSVEDLINKHEFCKVFSRYVILNSNGKAGKVKNIYDGDFNLL